jgi:peroxiredoxin
MDTILVTAQLVLAAVFATAGVAKLLDLPGSRKAVADFGVPAGIAKPLGTGLPLAEIAIALTLIFVPTARWGAVAALLLLAAFIGGIVKAMRRGEAPDCNCFGQIHSAPAGPKTLVRNVVLAAIATVVVADGPAPAIDGWIGDRSAGELVAIGVALVAAAAAAYFGRQFWEQRSEIEQLRDDLERARANQKEPEYEAEGLPIGEVAPAFELPALDGGSVSLAGLLDRGQPVVLFFMSPNCGPCGGLLPDLLRWQRALRERVTTVVVSAGSLEENIDSFAGTGVLDVAVDEQEATFHAYRVTATPSAIAIGRSGRIASAPAGGLHMPEVVMRIVVRGDIGAAREPEPAAVKVLKLGSWAG